MKHQVVILSTADFHSPVWTNKQHLAVGLAEDHDVVYIESLGLRQPSISFADAKRILRKITGHLRRGYRPDGQSATSLPSGLRVVSPLVIPFHKYAIVRFLNKSLLGRQIKRIVKDAENSTLWTFSPLTYGLESEFSNVIYHSVDLLHTLPRVPGFLLQCQERRLLKEVDHVVASSKGVEKHLRASGAKEILLWENVAHVELFSAATGRYRSNRAVFAGNLTPSKIDAVCLQSILALGIEIAIAGPIDIDGAGSTPEIAELLDHPKVTYYGNLDLPELAELLATSKIGLIPYAINTYTEGVFPMKVYEYLAAGLSVVSTRLPSLGYDHITGLHLVDAKDFGQHVQHLLNEHSDSHIAENVLTAETHSWTGRIKQASHLVAQPKR